MFVEIQSTDFVLRAWKKNPHLTKREIGVFVHWKNGDKENDRPLSVDEVMSAKMFLKQHAPTSYYQIFPEDRKLLDQVSNRIGAVVAKSKQAIVAFAHKRSRSKYVAKLKHCRLWRKAKLDEKDLSRENFEFIKTLKDDEFGHHHKDLVKCKECGQLYVKSFYEDIDWVNGDDAQYWYYAPVETVENLRRVEITDAIGLHAFTPYIRNEFPSDAKVPKIYWDKKSR